MTQSKIGTIEDDGEHWKLTIANPNKKHTVSKVISNPKKKDVLTRVDLDLIKDKEGKQALKSSVSEVYYPKYKYNIEDIEAAAQDIINTAKDVECPMCEKVKAALSVPEIKTPFETLLGLPAPEEFTDVFPSLSEILEPFEGLSKTVDDAIYELFHGLMPDTEASNESTE